MGLTEAQAEALSPLHHRYLDVLTSALYDSCAHEAGLAAPHVVSVVLLALARLVNLYAADF